MKKVIRTIPIVVELVQAEDKSFSYLVRNPQSGQVMATCETAEDVATFLNEIISKIESTDEKKDS